MSAREVWVMLGTTIGTAADQLARVAVLEGVPTFVDFNGVRMTAEPGETAVEILTRVRRGRAGGGPMSGSPVSLARPVRPSSPFPFSPLTDEAASRQSSEAARVLALHVIFPSPDAGLQRACVADARQLAADLLRSTDLRCGYDRAAWAGLPR